MQPLLPCFGAAPVKRRCSGSLVLAAEIAGSGARNDTSTALIESTTPREEVSLKRVLIAAMLVLLFQPVSGQSWSRHLELADSLSRLHQQDSALVHAELALEAAQAELGPVDTAVSTILFRLGLLHYQAADFISAQSYVEQALAMSEELLGPMHQQVAVMLDSLGTLLIVQGQYYQAEKICRRSLHIKENIVEPNDPTVAASLRLLAICCHETNRLSEADSLFRRALAVVETAFGPHHLEVARTLDNLGIHSRIQGDYAFAENCHRRALSIRRHELGPEHPDVAKSHGGLAVTLADQGKFLEAESHYQQAIAGLEQTVGPEHTVVAHNLGGLSELYAEMGRYMRAEQIIRRALAIHESTLGPAHPIVATGLGNLAKYCEQQGRFAEAESYYKRALGIWESAPGPVHLDAAYYSTELATLYQLMGKYDEAEDLQLRTIDIKVGVLGRQHPSVAHSVANLARGHECQGFYNQAESLYLASLTILENTLGDNHLEVGLLLNDLARMYIAQSRYPEAESLSERALSIEQSVVESQHPAVASSLCNLALIYQDQSRFDKAEHSYLEALDLREGILGSNHYLVAQTLEGYSVLCRLMGEQAEARRAAARACHIRQLNFADNAVVLPEKDALIYAQFLREAVGNYLSCYFDSDTLAGADRIAAANIILSNKGVVSDGVFERRRSMVAESDSVILASAECLRLVRFQLSQLFVRGPGEDVVGYQHRVDSLRERENELESELSHYSASFRRQRQYQNVNIELVRSVLPRHGILVEYVRSDLAIPLVDSTVPHYIALIISKEGVPEIVDLGSCAPLDSLVDRYRQHFFDVAANGLPSDNEAVEYRRISTALYRLVWQPIAPLVADKAFVLIAPDGSLHLISFAGLIDDSGSYLIERYTIHHLSAGRDLVRLQMPVESGAGLLALGDPDFDALPQDRHATTIIPADTPVSADTPYLSPTRSAPIGMEAKRVLSLPHTRREIERVAESFRNRWGEPTRLFYGADASEETLKAMAAGNRVIHLATHGYFLKRPRLSPSYEQRRSHSEPSPGPNPLLLSGLYLAGANRCAEASDSSGIEDGILTAYELSGMNLDGTQWVVLSACESGLGEVRSGEGVYGLRRSFQLAGVRTVISSIWPIPDKQTVAFMEQLYLSQEGDLAVAMRDAMVRRIEEIRQQHLPDHPFTWGGFIASGDWQIRR